MAYRRGQPIRTPLGGPDPIQSNHGPALAWLFLLLLLGGVLAAYEITETAGAAVSSPGLITRLLARSTPERPQPGSAAPGAAQRGATEVAAPALPTAAEPTPQPTAAPTPTRAPDRFRVANTDGAGLAFYSAPQREARLQRGLAEGAPVTALERVGTGWARVRADDGQEGWVGANYLVPAE